MLIAIDVHYRTDFAKAVSIEFANWQAKQVQQVHSVSVANIADYVPGEFYKRELPCIQKVLDCSDLTQVEAIIIDGYVVLNDEGKAGLGAHLYHALDQQIPIVGVAKKRFHNNQQFIRPVFRGQSQKPLYVSSIGLPVEWAAQQVASMKGDYRIPYLLKEVDRLSRAE